MENILQMIYCGMEMDVIMLTIIAVPTLICHGSFDSFHQLNKTILKQGIVTEIHLLKLTLL